MTIDDLRILRGLSMTKLCEAAGLSMGAVFKLTRPGAELERAQLGTVMKLAAGPCGLRRRTRTTATTTATIRARTPSTGR